MADKHLIRKVDEVGRVVIPSGLRRNYHIETGDSIEIFIDKDMLVLKKYNRGCFFCGEMDGLTELEGQKICQECAKDIINENK
jgi:transcriptional pleiotropic regulator of transition state genes